MEEKKKEILTELQSIENTDSVARILEFIKFMKMKESQD